MCSNAFEKPHWRLNQTGHSNEFCSIACRGAYRSEFLAGENAPDYVGGPKTYRGKGWLKVRAEVVAEQHGCCYDCGVEVGTSLPVHHKRPFREFTSVAEANDKANLVGLCQSCHMKAEYAKPVA